MNFGTWKVEKNTSCVSFHYLNLSNIKNFLFYYIFHGSKSITFLSYYKNSKEKDYNLILKQIIIRKSHYK